MTIKTTIGALGKAVGIGTTPRSGLPRSDIQSALDWLAENMQPSAAVLTALAALSPVADKLPYFTGPDTAALTDLSAFARTLLDDADAAAARSTLGLVIGTNVQAYDADLASWAGVTRASGFDAFAATPSSANLRSLLTDETGSGSAVFATSPALVTPTATSTASSTPAFTATNTTDNGTVTTLRLDGDRATPTANDTANIHMRLSNAAGTQTTFAQVDWRADDITAGSEDGRLIWRLVQAGSVTGKMVLTTLGLVPFSSDGLSLGLGTSMWSDLFLASGGVVNWGNGNTTLTHSAGQLALAGGFKITNTGSGDSLLIEDTTSTDSTPFVVDANGTVVIGHTARFASQYIDHISTARTPQFQMHGGSLSTTGMSATLWADTTSAPGVILAKSRNSPIGTHAAVLNNDGLGVVLFMGSDGTEFVPGAMITGKADGAGAVGSMAGKIVFSTSAPGSIIPTDRIVLDSLGILKPAANDGVALGTSALSFSDLFLASGAMISFANGDVTITHSANALAIAGGVTALDADSTVGGNKIKTVGKETIFVPAAAMIARTTNGAASGTSESSTNDVMTKTFDFDQTTEEGVGFWIAMPKSWDEGTVTFIPYWTAASGSGGVVWAINAYAFSDDDAIDQAPSGQQTSADTLIATGDVHVGPESSAITIGGSPAAGDMVYFQITREVGDGSDTLSGDAKLLGVQVLFTTDAATDA